MAEFSLGGAFLFYVIKYIVLLLVAFGGIMFGKKLHENK